MAGEHADKRTACRCGAEVLALAEALAAERLSKEKAERERDEIRLALDEHDGVHLAALTERDSALETLRQVRDAWGRCMPNGHASWCDRNVATRRNECDCVREEGADNRTDWADLARLLSGDALK